ncbi:MAG: iron-sulfur cluster assembly scaffold protein [Dehalococcoidia bacterium]
MRRSRAGGWSTYTGGMTSEAAEYNETVLDHFRNPRNAGEMADANAVGEDRNPVCGDHMRLFLRVEDGVITKASFLTRGCGAAIATSSVATEILTGRSVDEARALTRQDFVDAVGGLPKSKVHCSVLAARALKKALADYESRG